MQYGFIIPQGTIQEIIEMAREGEAAGWDAMFYWDGIYIESVDAMYDPWVVLTAMALNTKRVRLGLIISPISRRRPWKLARETVSVDQLSNGRLIVPVGLGAPDDGGFGKVGEPTDRKVRAQLLDEGLDILTGLWSGKPFSYQGEHYHLQEMTFRPTPVQQPRIPIWVVGAWPRPKSMQRALRYDGLIPYKLTEPATPMTPDDIRAIRAYIAANRTATTPFDIVWEGETPGDKPAQARAIVQPWVEAGITWWTESRWTTDDLEAVRTRIRQGPPRVE